MNIRILSPKRIIISLASFLISFYLITGSLFSQSLNLTKNQRLSQVINNAAAQSTFKPNYIPKKQGHYNKQDWAGVIDETWGAGLPTPQKLEIFDRAWNSIDQGYGAFMNLDVDWEKLRDEYRPEIAAGVSRGRFCAIMNYLSYALQDAHTFITDIAVSWGTRIQPGTPLFVVSAARDNSWFGACLTVLADSTLLVIRATPNHSLGLVPGDLVLGYDGIPWKTLYKELIDAQLPMSLRYVLGSTIESMTDVMLRSAGLNWHLFDTIDILKYSTADTLHLATSLLLNQTGRMWGNEQLDISGVPQPDFWDEDYITYGIMDGTNIGYIYVASWTWEDQYRISEQFYQAVYDLMFNHDTDGMIIDMRCNYGGSMDEARAAYTLLFNTTISQIGFDLRGDPNDHLDMVPHPIWPNSNFTIYGNYGSYYDKPIAVLTGPGAVSNGDWESVRLGFHPNARVFGKPTNGGFTLSDYPNLGNVDWFCTRATGSGYLIEGHVYMAHKSAPIDQYVWFTQEDVANGNDTVVEAAVAWILMTSAVESKSKSLPKSCVLLNNYPNPFNSSTNIRFNLSKISKLSIKIYNIEGKLVRSLSDGKTWEAGFDNIRWDGKDDKGFVVSSGEYLCTIKIDNFIKVRKMLLLK